MGISSKAPTSVKAAQTLFFVNAVIWLLLGITSLSRLAGSSTGQTTTMWIVALLMFGNAGLYITYVTTERRIDHHASITRLLSIAGCSPDQLYGQHPRTYKLIPDNTRHSTRQKHFDERLPAD